MKQLKIFFSDLVRVSRLTKTKNKKIRIIVTGVLSNLIVVLDILIILSFTGVFSNSITQNNFLIKYLSSNLYLLPVIVLLRFGFIYYEKINITKLRLEVEENLRDDLVEEIFSQGNYSSSDAYFYINTISGQVSSFYSTLATFVSSFLQVLAYSTFLIVTDLNVFLSLSGGVVILYFPMFYIVKLGRKTSHQTYTTSEEISEQTEKIVENLYLIKILNLAELELKRFSLSLTQYYESTLKNIKLGTISAIIPNFLTFFTLSIAIVFIDVVKFITLDFLGVALRLFQAIGVFNSNLHLVSAYHIYLEKLFLLQNNKETIVKENFVVEKSLNSENAISFKNVSFKYFNSDTNLFSGLNFDIPRNKHTVITGPNGSGKSTILGLLSGIIYAHEGEIKTFSMDYGFVGASPMIINASLRENLVYGSTERIEDRKLIEMIDIFEVFNEDNENILDLKISNKSLSTGQMQKISFIRALLKKVDILLLDESLSNVDEKSKKKILEIIKQLEITIINITHNLSEYEHYDAHLEISIVNEDRLVTRIS